MSSEVDVDCTSSCRLIHHGNVLTRSLTKREINEEKLISFIISSCGNFARNLDENVSEAINRRQQVITYRSFLGTKRSSCRLFQLQVSSGRVPAQKRSKHSAEGHRVELDTASSSNSIRLPWRCCATEAIRCIFRLTGLWLLHTAATAASSVNRP